MSVIQQECELEDTADEAAADEAVPAPPPPRHGATTTAPYRADWNGGGSWSALGLIVLLHVIALWGLMQIESVREAVKEAAPIMVGLVTLAPPEPPKPEPPPPPPPRLKPTPKPQMIAAQTPAPAPIAAPPPDPVVVEEPPPPPPPSEPAPPPPVIPPSFIAAYLDNPTPRYPDSSRRLGESGTVTLRVHVNAQGRPDSVEVHKSCGFARLDRAAIEAVRKWKFVPAKQGEEPIEAFVLVPLKFEL